jgi:hypothetical protein
MDVASSLYEKVVLAIIGMKGATEALRLAKRPRFPMPTRLLVKTMGSLCREIPLG